MLLHKVLQTAVREGILPQSPADRVDVPRNADTDMRVWDGEQGQMFLAEARRSSPLFRLYLFVATTGVRMGEALGLAWRHVYLALGTASIARDGLRDGDQTKRLFAVAPRLLSPREAELAIRIYFSDGRHRK